MEGDIWLVDMIVDTLEDDSLGYSVVFEAGDKKNHNHQLIEPNYHVDIRESHLEVDYPSHSF